LNFDYDDPVPNFDRRKVKGVAAQLISLSEEHYPKATALEITGGGKLFNVVIEDELVGRDLIKNGNMKKRVTFIPLNKIDPRRIDPKVCGRLSPCPQIEMKLRTSVYRNLTQLRNSLLAKSELLYR
jgi:chromosome segregation ATPase